MKYLFHIPEIPQSMQSVRFTKSGIMYQNADKRAYKDLVRWHIREQLKERYPEFKIMTGTIHVCKLMYIFPPKKTLTKSEKQLMMTGSFQLKKTKPDLMDNLAKGFFDALSGILYTDDAIISRASEILKGYNEEIGTYLIIEECNEWMDTIPALISNFKGLL